MKELADGSQVTSRSYYFLLDFNDRDSWETLYGRYNVKRLNELNKQQYIELFKTAVEREIKYLESNE